MIWLRGPHKLESFLGTLNSSHETIKFTWETSREKISYVDVMLSLNWKMVIEPNDAHQYLNFRSCHPPHVKKGIPHSQALVLKRIRYLEDKFEKKISGFEKFFG